MSREFAVDVEFYRLSGPLQPYFTSLYCFSIDCADGVAVADRLHPEWAAMRFAQSGNPPRAGIVPEPLGETWPFVISGPTSRAISFELTRSRIWGLGLLPAGWARFVRREADELADRIVDARTVGALEPFAPILEIVRQPGGDADTIAAQIDECLGGLLEVTPAEPEKVIACQEALRDPDIDDVDTLAGRLGMERRSLERLCHRHFGFPPKLLLRRQRFLRSLARFMLEPRANWSRALDQHYFDHAHFVRDFRAFMGMTPTEYAEAPHPVLDRIMAQRMADQGAAPQTDMPTVLRYAGKAPLAGAGK